MVATAAVRRVDRLERLSRLSTVVVAASPSCVHLRAAAGPALGRSAIPGFLVEQTLVVNDISGEGWAGHLQGIDYPQQVTRVDGFSVSTSEQFEAAIARSSIGENASFFTRLPGGDISLYPAVTTMPFPTRSLVRLFWVPIWWAWHIWQSADGSTVSRASHDRARWPSSATRLR